MRKNKKMIIKILRNKQKMKKQNIKIENKKGIHKT